jgi:hypothetical protein
MRRPPLWPVLRRFAWLLCLAAAPALLSGCVTTYQPLVSLQRPVAIDRRLPNFKGLRMSVRCLPGENLDPAEALVLCRNVDSLFAQQGAVVEVSTQAGGPGERDPAQGKPDLILELGLRVLQNENAGVLWLLFLMTGSMVPVITSQTVAQDVTVRDSQGFLLASESYQARFVLYFGLGVWGVNAALNLFVRSKEEEISEEASKHDFSRDLYDQLAQVAFHAHLRAQVLRGLPLAPPAPAPAPAAAAGSK